MNPVILAAIDVKPSDVSNCGASAVVTGVTGHLCGSCRSLSLSQSSVLFACQAREPFPEMAEVLRETLFQVITMFSRNSSGEAISWKTDASVVIEADSPAYVTYRLWCCCVVSRPCLTYRLSFRAGESPGDRRCGVGFTG